MRRDNKPTFTTTQNTQKNQAHHHPQPTLTTQGQAQITPHTPHLFPQTLAEPNCLPKPDHTMPSNHHTPTLPPGNFSIRSFSTKFFHDVFLRFDLGPSPRRHIRGIAHCHSLHAEQHTIQNQQHKINNSGRIVTSHNNHFSGSPQCANIHHDLLGCRPRHDLPHTIPRRTVSKHTKLPEQRTYDHGTINTSTDAPHHL